MKTKIFLFQTNIKNKRRNSCIIYLSSLLPMGFGNGSFDFVVHIFTGSILHIFIESSERKNRTIKAQGLKQGLFFAI